MNGTAYTDENGIPILISSYCVFLDFLGFSEEIKAASRNGQEYDLFQRFMRDIEPAIQQIIIPKDADNVEGFPRMWDAKVFTDNVVLGYALWSGHGENEFGHALFQLMEFQLAVALQGFFVRGGWSIGNLFMNQNTVFGSSLLEAVDLEKNAVYPRIVLSGGMKEYVFRHMSFYADDPPQCRHVLIDGAGTLMTHYLAETVTDDHVQWDWLDRHAQIITARLKEHAANQRVYEKYQWLAAYHNFFCDQLVSAEGYIEAVRVAGEFPNFGIRLLRREDSPYPPAPKKFWK